jgi:hypothetical protein
LFSSEKTHGVTIEIGAPGNTDSTTERAMSPPN